MKFISSKFIFGAVFLAVFAVTPILSYADHTTEVIIFYDRDLIRAEGNNKVYLLSPGKRRWIRDIDVFNSYKFKWEDVRVIPPFALEIFQLTNLIREKGDEKVYVLSDSGFKRHIPSPEVFESYGFDWNDIAPVPKVEVDAYPESRLIKREGDPKVYYIENGAKKWIDSIEAFAVHKFDWSEVQVVNDTETNFFKEGETITRVSTPPAPKSPESKKEKLEKPVEETAEPVSATTTEPISATTTEPAAEVTQEPIAEVEVPVPLEAAPLTGPAPAGGGGGGGGSTAPSSTPTPTPTPQCTRTVASGSQTYGVSSGTGQPQIQSATINPLKIEVGTLQTITVTARDTNDNPITVMTAEVIGDSSSSTISLSLNSGMETSGTWRGSWTSTLAPCANYQIKATATSASGTSSVTLSFL